MSEHISATQRRHLKPSEQVPGYCVNCAKPTHRRSPRGTWYKLCDDCRTTDPKPNSWTDELPEQPPPLHPDQAAEARSRGRELAERARRGDPIDARVGGEPLGPAQLDALGRAPAPKPQPQQCPYCDKWIQPKYVQAHMAGRDANDPDCPHQSLELMPDLSPRAAPEPPIDFNTQF